MKEWSNENKKYDIYINRIKNENKKYEMVLEVYEKTNSYNYSNSNNYGSWRTEKNQYRKLLEPEILDLASDKNFLTAVNSIEDTWTSNFKLFEKLRLVSIEQLEELRRIRKKSIIMYGREKCWDDILYFADMQIIHEMCIGQNQEIKDELISWFENTYREVGIR
jgi:hypothetical protein